jgi:uncharacterized membrane protein
MNKIDFLQILHQELAENNVSDRADILYDYEEHFRIGEENGKTETELIAELGDPENIAKQYYTPIEIQEKTASASTFLKKDTLPDKTIDATHNTRTAIAIDTDTDNANANANANAICVNVTSTSASTSASAFPSISTSVANTATVTAASPITIRAKESNPNHNVKQQPIIAPFIVASALLLFNLIFVAGPYVGLLGTLIGLFAAAFAVTISGLAMALAFLFAPFFPEFINVMDSFSTVTMLSIGVGTTALGLLFIIGVCYLSKYFYLLTKKYIKWNIKVIKG